MANTLEVVVLFVELYMLLYDFFLICYLFVIILPVEKESHYLFVTLYIYITRTYVSQIGDIFTLENDNSNIETDENSVDFNKIVSAPNRS